MSENKNGTIRCYGHGPDSGVHGFGQIAGTGWSGHNDLNGRFLGAPQLVRTSNKLQTMLAFDANGVVWLRPQQVLNGSLHVWRKPTGASSTWHPWTEIGRYVKETAVDPTLALADGTSAVAFRTPAVRRGFTAELKPLRRRHLLPAPQHRQPAGLSTTTGLAAFPSSRTRAMT